MPSCRMSHEESTFQTLNKYLKFRYLFHPNFRMFFEELKESNNFFINNSCAVAYYADALNKVYKLYHGLKYGRLTKHLKNQPF